MSEPQGKFTVGLFGFLSIAGALIIFLWVSTFQIQELLYPLMTASFFLIGGFCLAYILTGIRVEPFRLSNFIMTIIATVLNVVVIMYVNQLIPIRFDFSVVSPRLFGILVAVAEECFFRLFFCGMVYQFTGSFLLAIVSSSAVWSTYHIARYGTSMNIWLIIFICGCVLGATFLYTKNADGSIFGHAVVNYIALA